MYCESCGSFVRDGLSYCPACGAKIIEVFVPTMPKEAPAPAPAPGPAQAQAPAYTQAPSYASQPAYAQAPAQPAYSQPIQPAPPVTAGNSVPILQAPVVQAIPVSQQAGQPLTQSVEVDPALYYVVFAWRNDNSTGAQAPAAVDNIVIRHTDFPTDIESGAGIESNAVKFIHNDQVYIMINGAVYNVTGQKVELK